MRCRWGSFLQSGSLQDSVKPSNTHMWLTRNTQNQIRYWFYSFWKSDRTQWNSPLHNPNTGNNSKHQIGLNKSEYLLQRSYLKLWSVNVLILTARPSSMFSPTLIWMFRPNRAFMLRSLSLFISWVCSSYSRKGSRLLMAVALPSPWAFFFVRHSLKKHNKQDHRSICTSISENIRLSTQVWTQTQTYSIMRLGVEQFAIKYFSNNF